MDVKVILVGAGHAGIATAAALKKRGVDALVLERSGQIGSSWIGRYDSLRLNTERWGSRLPGMRLDTGCGRWPSGREFAEYLRRYAERSGIPIQFATEVKRIDKSVGKGYCLQTSSGPMSSLFVILATGPDCEADMPDWPGIGTYTGELLHSASYRQPFKYIDKSVLVVGGGESGADIATDLVRHGAKKVSLSVRNPPYIVTPDFCGIPSQFLAITARWQPRPVFDFFANLMRRLSSGDLSEYGLPMAPSLHDSARVRGKPPILDRGFVEMVRARRIEIVPAVEAIDGSSVSLSGAVEMFPDVVIAATGYRTGMEPLVGHLGVLDGRGRPVVNGAVTHPNAEGLFFVGYLPVLSGAIREAGRMASKIARAVHGGLRSTSL